jgi:hypothetical protein
VIAAILSSIGEAKSLGSNEKGPANDRRAFDFMPRA